MTAETLPADSLPALDAVYSPAARIVGRRIADEYVLVPLAGRGADLDSILSLNSTGAFIWEQLDGRRDGRAIVEAMLDRFDTDRVSATRDYREFLGKLESVHTITQIVD